MKILPLGNCPYCDADTNTDIVSSWGMSPQGWINMKNEHDAGHPNYKEQKSSLTTNIK